MADNQPAPKPDTMLIAHVTAYLVDGSSFELYPFLDENDVKSKVSELAGGWADSGFLLRDSHLVPWHQVKLLETTSVEEITREEVQVRLNAWHAEDQKRAEQNFWKTKEEPQGGEKKDGGEKSDGDKDVQGGGH